LKKHLEERLTTLRAEFEKGQMQLKQIEVQVYRIHGAIILLEELLKQPELEEQRYVAGRAAD
jgi:hypothetical protein